MDLVTLKLIAAIIIFLVAIIAAWFPFKKAITSSEKHNFPAGEALACGLFLGIGLIHMLSHANILFSQVGCKYPWAFVLTGISFLMLLLLEHIATEINKKKYNSDLTLSILAVVILSVHSFFVGAALGISNQLTIVLMVFIAIIAHKWAAGFALAVQINNAMQAKKGIYIYLLFAIMTPLGILFGDLINNPANIHPMMEPIFTSLAAGTFLYLGTLHGLKRAVLVDYCCNLKHFSWVIVGFAMMALIPM